MYVYYYNIRLNIPFPPELGSYLLRVSNDAALYSSYFWWRDYYSLVTHHKTYQDVRTAPAFHLPLLLQAFCDICQALHDPGRGEERIGDLVAWWAGGGGCKKMQKRAKKVNFDSTFWVYRNRDRDSSE